MVVLWSGEEIVIVMRSALWFFIHTVQGQLLGIGSSL